MVRLLAYSRPLLANQKELSVNNFHIILVLHKYWHYWRTEKGLSLNHFHIQLALPTYELLEFDLQITVKVHSSI